MASIVKLTIQQILAPTPNNLQSKGAFLSQGATMLAAGASSRLSRAGDLAALLVAPLALTSLAWAGGTVTGTAPANIAGSIGDKFVVNIAGATPAGYNGTYTATIASATTFTYALAANPGAETAPGTYTKPGVAELQSQANSFFGQGAGQAVSVLELGPGGPAATIAALQAYMQVNPAAYYMYLTPRDWDGQAAFITLAQQYEALTAMTYFFATSTPVTYQNYAGTLKSVLLFVESPDASVSEFQAAAAMQAALALAPTTSNRLTPFGLTFMYGVTPWADEGNTNAFAAMDAANVNYVTTAAEGGLSTAMLANGKTLDGKPFNYYYAVDWLQINLKLDLANAVINGANNKQNPLVYDQPGIDRLQDVAVGTVRRGITVGCLTGALARDTLDTSDFLAAVDDGEYAGKNVVNAEPFASYTEENPSDFGNGIYDGISVGAIPMRGFDQIGVSVSVTDLVAA